MNHAAFQASRFVDDPLEQPHDRIGIERSFAGHPSDVIEHLLLTIRLVQAL